jgi:uncharacterized membrane protein YgdD (TMEM256/DUF423 family)
MMTSGHVKRETSGNSPVSMCDQLRRIAAFLGATGVTLGAFGSHGLKHRMPPGSPKLENWKTAVMYQLVHAVTILSISAISECKQQHSRSPSIVPPDVATSSTMVRAGQFMALGTFLFSGSIYLLCLDVSPKKLWGPTTPLGGLLIIAGWTLLLGFR